MIFIQDKHENLVETLSNENPKSCPYYDDLQFEKLDNSLLTYEFSVPKNNPISSLIEIEGYVVRQDLDGNYLQFRIKDTDENKVGNKKIIKGENAALELREHFIKPQVTPVFNPTEIMSYILDNERWEPGIIEITETREWTFDKYINKLAALQMVKTTFNAELVFRVEKKGNRITRRFVDLLKTRGRITGKRFEYNRDIKGLRRLRTSYELYTAVYAVGTDDSGNQFTISDVEWKKSSGHSADKPTGQVWIGHQEAFEKWNRDGRHIYGYYESTTAKTPNDLLDEAWTFLLDHIEPKATYELDAVMLERILGKEYDRVRIGDTVGAFDMTFQPPLLIEARVIELERSYSTKDRDRVILGDAKELAYKSLSDLKFIREKINRQYKALSVNTGVLQGQINEFSSEGSLTLSEAKAWDISATQIKKESMDIIVVSDVLNIGEEKTAYETAVTDLDTTLANWLNKDTYPLNITEVDRTEVVTKFENVQDLKSQLLNKITDVQSAPGKEAREWVNGIKIIDGQINAYYGSYSEFGRPLLGLLDTVPILYDGNKHVDSVTPQGYGKLYGRLENIPIPAGTYDENSIITVNIPIVDFGIVAILEVVSIAITSQSTLFSVNEKRYSRVYTTGDLSSFNVELTPNRPFTDSVGFSIDLNVMILGMR